MNRLNRESKISRASKVRVCKVSRKSKIICVKKGSKVIREGQIIGQSREG